MMRILFLSLVAGWLSLAAPCISFATAQAGTTTFESFPVNEHFAGRPAKPRLATKQDREFATALHTAAKQAPNFAGHFILTSIGCGASCVMTAVLDAKTGRVAWVPFTLCCWGEDIREPVEFRLDSDLIVLRGRKNEGEAGTWHLRFIDGEFIPVAAGKAAPGAE